MNRQRQFATWSGAVLGAICALFLLSLAAHASDQRCAITEEFHQTYALTPDGRVELDNINGPVHISSWDRNEVKVDAVKYADTKERLDEARIEVDSGKDYLSIRTKYRDHDLSFDWGSHNNPAGDRKSTRLNSSHQIISYAVFCLKKKKPQPHGIPSIS